MHMAYIYLNALTRRQPSVKGRSTETDACCYVCMYVCTLYTCSIYQPKQMDTYRQRYVQCMHIHICIRSNLMSSNNTNIHTHFGLCIQYQACYNIMYTCIYVGRQKVTVNVFHSMHDNIWLSCRLRSLTTSPDMGPTDYTVQVLYIGLREWRWADGNDRVGPKLLHIVKPTIYARMYIHVGHFPLKSNSLVLYVGNVFIHMQQQ